MGPTLDRYRWFRHVNSTSKPPPDGAEISGGHSRYTVLERTNHEGAVVLSGERLQSHCVFFGSRNDRLLLRCEPSADLGRARLPESTSPMHAAPGPAPHGSDNERLYACYWDGVRTLVRMVGGQVPAPTRCGLRMELLPEGTTR